MKEELPKSMGSEGIYLSNHECKKSRAQAMVEVL